MKDDSWWQYWSWRVYILIIAGLLIMLSLIYPVNRSWGINQRINSPDLIVFYSFTAVDGTNIKDLGYKGTPALDLLIEDSGKVTWLKPGLRVTEATVITTSAERTKLMTTQFFTDGFTIEAWIKPVNNTQDGPARIVTFSQDSGDRNFTFGQSGDRWNMRFRTTENPGNGSSPSVSTPASSIVANPVLQHVVYTRNKEGTAKFYIDNLLVQSAEIPGEGANWDRTYGFGLFNEINYPVDTRTWLGDLFMVAIYCVPLTAAQIGINFNAGVPVITSGGATLVVAWDPNTEPDLMGYNIYVGTASGDYSDSYDVRYTKIGWGAGCTDPYDPSKADCCEFKIPNLVSGRTYYIAATAYDEDDNESAYSEELVHTVQAGISPDTPKGLMYKGGN